MSGTATLASRARSKRDAHLAEAARIVERAGGKALSVSDEARVENAERAAATCDQRAQRYARLSKGPSITEARAQLREAARVQRAELVYRPDRRESYFRDLIFAKLNGPGSDFARRIARHHEQMADMARTRDEGVARSFTEAVEKVGGTYELEQRTNPNRTDGQGGYLAPPAWLVDKLALAPAIGRPVANACTLIPLPGGVQSINIPALTTNVGVAMQTVDAAGMTETEIVDTSIGCEVETVQGKLDVSLQLLEQAAPPGFDELMLRDFMRVANAEIETQVVAGSASAGQVRGVLNESGITTTTYTDASPTPAEAYAAVLQCIANTARARKLPPEMIALTTSRWAWFQSAVSTDGILQNAPGRGHMPDVADLTAGDTAPIGPWAGFPTWLSHGIPENAGAGTDEDRILVLRPSDFLLFESAQLSARVETFTDALAGTLSARIRFHTYIAFLVMQPTAIGVVSGTGCIVQSGY